ncbi:CinA family protein [Microbacterium sp. R86528]|uniref:CinA family protein n=1 Tax=Microbacterium sp. R86528 TaxID=3093864 RepID=UPI0037CBEB67
MRTQGAITNADTTDVELLADAARKAGLTVAAAESLTSGLLASRIGAGKSASVWFRGAVIAYQTSVKQALLGLPAGVDPCSSECAVTLAQNVRRMLAADVAVSTTGIGGPDPQDGHAPGTVYLGWSTSTSSGYRRLNLSGNPEEVIEQAARVAIQLLTEITTTPTGPARDEDATPGPVDSA